MKTVKGPRLAMAVTHDRAPDQPVDLLLYDVIDSWGGDSGVAASEVVERLAEYDGRDLTVRINSEGGVAHEGAAIYAALSKHTGRVDVVIEGIAASAASFIAMAGDTVSMHDTATMMIHGASGLVYGNADDMRDMANSLDVFNRAMARAYAARSSKSEDEWLALMGRDTWYTADTARDEGLVDNIIPAGRASVTPRHLATAITHHRTALHTTTEGDTMTTTTILDQPSTDVPDGSSWASLDSPRTTTAPEAPSDGSTWTVATAPEVPSDGTMWNSADPSSTVVLDRTVYEDLVARATRSQESEQQRRDRVVDDAVASGRIPPSRADHWRQLLTKDPGAEAVLASLAPGLVPVTELGAATTPADVMSESEALFRSLFPRPN